MPAARKRLLNRRVLVTGAGTRKVEDPDAPVGNGRAIAVLAAREGATVACADIDGDAARETARLIEDEGGKATVLLGDMSDADDCARVVHEAAAALGGLDALVCNVGIGLGRGLEDTTVEQWDLVHSVNVRSHFLAARAALPIMGEGSAIVFISSIAGIVAGTRIPAYDTSKAALG